MLYNEVNLNGRILYRKGNCRYSKGNKVTVQRWCKTKDLPAVKIGKSYRIEKHDFEDWYKSKKGVPLQKTLEF
jgi:excisionase family DNA binding protein